MNWLRDKNSRDGIIGTIFFHIVVICRVDIRNKFAGSGCILLYRSTELVKKNSHTGYGRFDLSLWNSFGSSRMDGSFQR